MPTTTILTTQQIAIDASLNTASNNAVRNSAIATAVNAKQDTLTAGGTIDITSNVVTVKISDVTGNALSVKSDGLFATDNDTFVDAGAGMDYDPTDNKYNVNNDGSTILLNAGNRLYVPTATSSTAGIVTVDSALNSSSANPVQNGVVVTALNNKTDNSNTVTDSTSTSVSTTLASNTVYYYTADLTILMIQGVASGFQYCNIQFNSGSTATTFSMPADPATPTPTTHYYCVGTDCSSGTFTPYASTRYNLAVEQEADRIAIYVMEAE